MLNPIHKSSGVNQSESILTQICERTFLNLWSYPNIFKKQGKELCDVLAICGDDILIFSDKSITFSQDHTTSIAHKRWFRRAVVESAEQVHAAENWIRRFPDRLYLDAACSKPFPLTPPTLDRCRFHRIVIANGAEEECRQFSQGGSGSLCLVPTITAKMTLENDDVPPFAVGDLDPDRGYVHVFNEVSLRIIMEELDTVTDFITYLRKKEEFVRSGALGIADSEEDLLAYYLNYGNRDDPEHFFIPSVEHLEVLREKQVLIRIPSGTWTDLKESQSFVERKIRERSSYIWDGLIERFTKHIIDGTSILRDESHTANDIEPCARVMALEPRSRRGLLSNALLEAMRLCPSGQMHVRWILGNSSRSPFTAYLILQFPNQPGVTGQNYVEYRRLRQKLLLGRAILLKDDHPELDKIVGIAMEPAEYQAGPCSEDLLMYEPGPWDEEAKLYAQDIRSRLKPDKI